MRKGDKLEGKVFCVGCMDAEMGWKVVGDGSCRGWAAIDELHRDRVSVGKGRQVVLGEEGGVNAVVRGARIDECSDWYGGVVRNEKMNKEREVAGLWEGKGGG